MRCWRRKRVRSVWISLDKCGFNADINFANIARSIIFRIEIYVAHFAGPRSFVAKKAAEATSSQPKVSSHATDAFIANGQRFNVRNVVEVSCVMLVTHVQSAEIAPPTLRKLCTHRLALGSLCTLPEALCQHRHTGCGFVINVVCGRQDGRGAGESHRAEGRE